MIDYKTNIFFKLTLLILFLVIDENTNAQISPTGVGDAQIAEWSALGIQQKLNSSKTWESMTYVGWANKSIRNYNPLDRKDSWVLNEAITHKMKVNNWRYALSFIYKHKTKYSYTDDNINQSVKQEFRTYGSVNYPFKLNYLTIVPTFRQEVRRFYTSDFDLPTEDLEFRTRFRLQFIFNLDKQNEHRIIGSSEQLFTFDHDHKNEDWSKYSYNESRFMLYYSYSPSTIPIQLDLGYKNDLLGTIHPHSANYIAFDVIIKNPFF